MGSVFDADSWFPFQTITPPPPLPYPMLQHEEMLARRRRRSNTLTDEEKVNFGRPLRSHTLEAKESHSKMVEALAAQERAEQRAESEKARADELQKNMLAAIGRAKEAEKSSEESHSKMVAALEAQERAELSAKADKALARRREEKLQETVERMKSEHDKNILDLQSRSEKEKDELIRSCARLWKCLRLKEKEVADEVVLEKDELKAKVEELSKSLEEAMAREISKLEEEYDKIAEYEGLETWECCNEVDETS